MARPVVLISGKHPIHEEGGEGHSSYVRAHALAALRAGYEPHLFAAGPVSSVSETNVGVVHVCRTPLRPYRQTLIPVHAEPLARAVEGFARQQNPSEPLLVHGFGVWTYAGVLAARRLRRQRVAVKVVASSYTTYLNEAISQLTSTPADAWGDRFRYAVQAGWIATAVVPFERAGYTQAQFVMVNYRSVETLIRRAFGRVPRIRHVRYASEHAFLAEDASPADVAARRAEREGIASVVAVAQHGPRKGIDVLITAFARLRDRGVPFRATLVGGGVLLEEHRALVQRLQLNERVVMAGRVPEVRPYLDAADLFVLPSLREQSGSLALIEAMQAGLPVVAAGCDGILEDIDDGRSGLLVPPGDADALAARLEEMIRSRERRLLLGHAARRVFEERFSAAAFTDDLAAAYAGAILPDVAR